MPDYDLILVHAPSVYDFREKSLIYGPVADLIPSTPVFEMYPIGFTTIASGLSSRGYRVRILNLAAHMLADRSFDVERAVQKLRSTVFGIDLHWMPHAHGSLEIARLIKHYHPDSMVVIGGFSSTYYHEEILRDHQYIDAVFLGDSTEQPMIEFMRRISSGKTVVDVPNLAFREDGRVRSNGITHVVQDLDEVEFDYGLIVKSVMRSFDLTGHLPYLDWKRNPMLLVSTVRGCTHGCATCMGACDSFGRNFARQAPAYRSPEKLLEDIGQIESYFRGAIFLLGDIQQPGRKYSERFLSLLREERPKNEIVFEFFNPPGEDIIRMIGSSAERFDAQISPDSHDPGIRSTQGRKYSNESLEKSIDALLQAGARRVDIFFMIGLPGQDRESVMETVKYSEQLMLKEHASERLLPFISPLAPFIDAGSDAFENPERYGYTILARTLAEHRDLLLHPSWKYVLNYETRLMSREQLVDATYEAGLGINEAKLKSEAISPESGEAVRQRILMARDAMREIDQAVRSSDPERSLKEVREKLASLREAIMCNKSELDWSVRSFYWSIPRAMLATLQGR